jgi:hypothetical protein
MERILVPPCNDFSPFTRNQLESVLNQKDNIGVNSAKASAWQDMRRGWLMGMAHRARHALSKWIIGVI